MLCNFDISLREVLEHEGGFVNHPKDPGGMTNLGVTKATLEDYLGRTVTEAEMRALTPTSVRELYLTNYWHEVNADSLPAGLDLMVFDFAVNAGPARARKFLQRLCGAAEDGILGPVTMRQLQQALSAHGVRELIRRYAKLRTTYYKRLKTFPTFGRGWLRRVAEVQATAFEMAEHG